MAEVIRFTKKSIENLPPAPKGKRTYYEDSRYPGLRLSVTATGTKSWVLQQRVNGRPRRFTLGNFPAVSIENARKRYDRKRGEIADGKNRDRPQQEKEARRATLEDVYDEFLKARSLKDSTVKGYTQVLNATLGDWLKMPLAEITKPMVADRHAKLSKENGKAYADSAMRTLSSIWGYAEGRYEDDEGESLLPSNPVKRLSKTRAWNRPKARKNYLKEHQLKPWFEAVGKLRIEPWGTMPQTVGDYLTLVILTGLRRSEAATLPWSQVDLTDRTLWVTETKNHEDLILPISDYLLELLKKRREHIKEEYVFPGGPRSKHPYMIEPRNQVKRVIKESGVVFGIHDLRRTFASVTDRLNLPEGATSRFINHSKGNSVTRNYIITDLEHIREPMQRITNYILEAAYIR